MSHIETLDKLSLYKNQSIYTSKPVGYPHFKQRNITNINTAIQEWLSLLLKIQAFGLDKGQVQTYQAVSNDHLFLHQHHLFPSQDFGA